MSEYVKLATAAGDQYLAALSEAQENFLKTMAPFSEWTSKLPTPPATPFAADVPTVQEITEANFAFANKVLKQQKKFADKLFSVSAFPVSPVSES